MAIQKLLLVFCFALLSSVEGFRVNSLSRDKVEARGRSTAKVNFKRVRSTEGSSSNSSIFIAAGLIGAFAGTLSVTAAAPGVVTAAAGTTALVSNCAPTVALITPFVTVGGAASPALMIVVPLAILAALALIGGLVALHISTTAALAALAFCPVSNFQQQPMQALVSSQPYLAFPEDLPEMLDDGLDGGMPECHDLRSAILSGTKCASDDKECHEHACREKCCEDDACTFYQFSTNSDVADGQQEEVVCQLGEKYQMVDKNCEKPFFGEMCLSRLPLWGQEGKDHTKCLSGYGAGSGFMVDDQMDCQETAMENGHCWYQYDDDKKTCATCEGLDDVSTNTRENWKVYKDPKCGGSHVVGGVACTEWQLKKVLMHKVKGTQEVRPTTRGCRGNAAQCLKKRCRQACSADDTCTFYQFQEGQNLCRLGTAESLETQDVEEPHFGGFVTSDRKCTTGFQCPANNMCVEDCTECDGYSTNGKIEKGRGKSKRSWCMRSPVQSLCYEDNWVPQYRGVAVDEWCDGMEKVTVRFDESLDARETGENICRNACCSDPDCSVYQMKESLATKKGSDFKKGDELECWIGQENAAGKPQFKCSGSKLKKWRKEDAPVGGALSKRGCTDGSTACLTKRACVDHCRTECMGAPLSTNGVCMPEFTEEEEKLDWKDDPTHKHAMKDNIQHAFPRLATQGTDDNYYLEKEKETESRFQEKDDILQLQMNSQKVASGKKKDMAEACQSLKDDDEDMLCWHEPVSDACKCTFKEKQECSTWFHDGQHLKHVVEDIGMLVFTGDKCKCATAADADGEYTCEFGLLESVPPVKADKDDKVALRLAGTAAIECPVGQCDDKMGGSGEVVKFGNHNCGYTYVKQGEEFYCDRQCNCHKELSQEEADSGKKLEDDECLKQTCPGMSKCEPLDYGSYGCGYSCENSEGTFHFCTQDCECEAE